MTGIPWKVAVILDNRSSATTYSSVIQLRNGSYAVQYGVGATHGHKCIDTSCHNEQAVVTFD